MDTQGSGASGFPHPAFAPDHDQLVLGEVRITHNHRGLNDQPGMEEITPGKLHRVLLKKPKKT
jgi:hypothetical protein